MNTMKTAFEYNELGDQLTIIISGELSAASSFPAIPAKKVKKITIQLEEAGYINSFGVQNWISWINEAQAANENVTFNFQMLPSNFARLAFQVRGFLPEQSVIESLMVPYFCSHCAINFTVKYTKGVNWDKDWSSSTFIEKISYANCIICKTSGELDAIPEVYTSLNLN